MKSLTGSSTKAKAFLKMLVGSLMMFSGMSQCTKSPTEVAMPDFPKTKFGQMSTHLSYGVIKEDHTLWTWGFNATGALGNGTLESTEIPQQVPLQNVVTFKFSDGLTLAADFEGNIWYWGKCILWITPNPAVTRPVKISKLEGVIDFVVFSEFLLLRENGTVWRLDWDYRAPTAWLTPEPISTINDVTMISGALSLKRDGNLVMTDAREYPIVANGGLPHPIDDVMQMQNVYNQRTLVLKRDSTVWAWGEGTLGELGSGEFVNHTEPVWVLGLSKIIEISANFPYNLALKEDGTVWYWGYVGKEDGVDTGIATPVQVEGLDGVVAIHANQTCMVKKDDGTYWTFSYLNARPTLKMVFQE